MVDITGDQLKEIVHSLTTDTRLRGKNLFFDPVPLFAVLGATLSNDDIDRCLREVIGDGFGDPIDLDPADDQQTSRLESTILSFFDHLEIKELFTIEYLGWPHGLHRSLCLASFADLDFVVLYDPYEIPSFMTFGCGDEALKWVKREGDILLPRFCCEDAEPVQVRIHRQLRWTSTEILSCVQNLTGFLLHEEQLFGADRLISNEDPES